MDNGRATMDAQMRGTTYGEETSPSRRDAKLPVPCNCESRRSVLSSRGRDFSVARLVYCGLGGFRQGASGEPEGQNFSVRPGIEIITSP